MKIRENVPISSLTTMRLGGDARFVIEITDLTDLPEALDFAGERNLPVWFMGGGANTIGRDEGFPGVILLNKLKGVEIIEESGESLVLRAMGGEIWDNLVEFAVSRGYTGIEAMSGIPGTVGAAPVQNIGAYGQDVAQTLVEVEAYDTREKRLVKLSKEAAKMSYRRTIFNFGPDAGRYFITAIILRLRLGAMQPPYYNSLQKYIDEHPEEAYDDSYHQTNISSAKIRAMILKIREEKLPDPQKSPSAGSFFKNVNLAPADADVAEKAGVKLYRNPDGSGKVNSGWLIEQCGLKGKVLHGFRVSEKAALVLINEGAEKYADLAAARAEIIDAVRKKFGFTLEQEPVEIPVNSKITEVKS